MEIALDALIVPVASGDGGPQWPELLAALAAELSDPLIDLAMDARFAGKEASTFTVPTLGYLPAKRLILAGVGKPGQLGEEGLVRAAGAAIRAATDAGAERIAFALPDKAWGMESAAALESFAIGAALASYRFDGYRGTASPETSARRHVDTVLFADSSFTQDISVSPLR
ncbi:MAG: hypothetical protein H0T18_05475, partial [Chloroflexia bacterium]|nr:hypothetical protein [Chloroflexia bacterium]